MFTQRERRPPAAGTMKSFCDFRVGVILALVVLSLCSYGAALQCYSCPGFSKSCETTTTCTGSQNACLKLTVADSSTYRCTDMSRCEREFIKQDFGDITNYKYGCCQKNLCNSSMTSLPSTGLLLSLAAALLLVFCR